MWIHFAAVLIQATCAQDGGTHQWRIETPDGPIRVFAPSDRGLSGIAIYVHGYGTTVDRAWEDHRLPEQFRKSCLPWLFIAPEAPLGPRDRVRFPELERVLEAVEREAGPLPAGPIVALGHSGAYRTLRDWLPARDLSTIVMLDAAYGQLAPFAAWMQRDRGHGMILLGRSTLASTRALSLAIGADPECGDDLFAAAARPSARASCFRSRDDHMQIVERGAAIPAVLRLASEMSRTHPWPSSRPSSLPPSRVASAAGS
jgi:hypothetical protein